MLEPEGYKVIIKPVETETITKGGLYIPETVRDKYQIAVTRGKIVAIGPQANIKFMKGPAEVGDKVVYAKYGGAMIKWDNENYRILNDEDVVALITDEEKLQGEGLIDDV